MPCQICHEKSKINIKFMVYRISCHELDIGLVYSNIRYHMSLMPSFEMCFFSAF